MESQNRSRSDDAKALGQGSIRLGPVAGTKVALLNREGELFAVD